MIVIWGILLGVVVGFLRGGTFANLGTLRLRGVLLVFAALGIQLLTFPTPWWPQPPLAPVSAIAHIASYVLIAVFVVINRRVRGIVGIALGGFLNVVVIVANGGHMPSKLSALAASGNVEAATHLAENPGRTVGNVVAMGPDTRLNILGDRMYLPQWVPFGASFSIGDAVLAIGMLWLIQRAMVVGGGRGE